MQGKEGAMSVIIGRRVAEYHPPARVPRCSCSRSSGVGCISQLSDLGQVTDLASLLFSFPEYLPTKGGHGCSQDNILEMGTCYVKRRWSFWT